MEIQVARGVFAEEISWTSRVIPQRPTNPVLNGLLIEATGDGLMRLSATDQYASSSTTVEAMVSSPGRVVIPGKLTASIAAKLPQQPVVITMDGNRMVVECGRSKFGLPVSPLELYPALPQQPDQVGTLAGQEFSDAVMQVVFAAAKDDTVPALSGVQVKCSETELTLIATDRYRLAVKKVPWVGQVRDPFLLRARSLAELAKPSSPNAVILSLNTDNTLFGMTSGARRSTMPMLESQAFPDVERLIPTDGTTVVEVDISELVDAVQRVRLVVERASQPIKLHFFGGEVMVSASSGPDANASEGVLAKIEGDDIEIAFNPEYLVEGLSALAGQMARFQFTSSAKPVLLDAPEDVSYRHILMPVRI